MNNFSSVAKTPWFWAPVSAFTCALLCAVSSLYPNLYLLGWVAFVPFLLGLQKCRSSWQAYGFGLLTGYLVFGFSSYWMAEFIRIFKHYSFAYSASLASVYWFFCAQMFAIIAVITHIGRRGTAVLWVFPTALTLVFAFYPMIFPWQIGNAQVEFTVAIQATDIAGVSGLDFIIAVVNVLVAQLFVNRDVFFRRSVWVGYALVTAWFAYGVISLAYWDSAVKQWATLKVGFVQPDEPPSVGAPGARDGFSLSYPIEMDFTEQMAEAGADLVIWPEYEKHYFAKEFVRRAFQRQLSELSTPVLLQSSEKDGGERYNTAVLLGKNGQLQDKYRKIKRIAMAEYLPFFEHSEKAKDLVRPVLGEFFGNYSAGPEPKSFAVNGINIQPFICYEIIFPRFIANSVQAAQGNILTTQSNNSWFGATRVPYQHRAASIIRSVENRRPLIHVMNNGLSVVALASGRKILDTEHNTTAGYLIDVPYPSGASSSFYSRYPSWFVIVLGLSLVLIIIRAKRNQ